MAMYFLKTVATNFWLHTLFQNPVSPPSEMESTFFSLAREDMGDYLGKQETMGVMLCGFQDLVHKGSIASLLVGAHAEVLSLSLSTCFGTLRTM